MNGLGLVTVTRRASWVSGLGWAVVIAQALGSRCPDTMYLGRFPMLATREPRRRYSVVGTVTVCNTPRQTPHVTCSLGTDGQWHILH